MIADGMRREVFGDTSSFALEIQYDLAASDQRVVVGHFFYWVGGRQVGDGGYPNLSDVFECLANVAGDCGKRQGGTLWTMSAPEILHWFDVGRYWSGGDAIDPSLPQDADPYDLMFHYGVAKDPLFLIAHGERARVWWFPDGQQPGVRAEGEVERFEGAIKDAYAFLKTLHEQVGFGAAEPAILRARRKGSAGAAALHKAVSKWPSWFPKCPPVRWIMRHWFDDRWFRIHSLPKGKRYPTTREERRLLLERHATVSKEVLGEASACVVVIPVGKARRPRSTRRSVAELGAAMLPGWEKIWPAGLSEDIDEVLEGTGFAVAMCTWRFERFTELILDVAFDISPVHVAFVALDTGRVYSPYDGGADLFVGTPEEADALRAKYEAFGWTPPEVWPDDGQTFPGRVPKP